uniref:SAYSvFN domain-containing protein n=1 Tax=Megaselia scalaris TaxID=36166 RepID=T1H4S9_MEGSC
AQSKKEDLNSSDVEDDEEVEPFSSDEELDEEFQEAKKTAPSKPNWLKYTLWAVYFLFWATCYAIAIELKFGVVFLMFSALFGIYFNTRTTPKKRNEVSAYSVFNKDCKAIDGSIKAEQFENEIRHGFNSVR